MIKHIAFNLGLLLLGFLECVNRSIVRLRLAIRRYSGAPNRLADWIRGR